jgi:hypothetical protein
MTAHKVPLVHLSGSGVKTRVPPSLPEVVRVGMWSKPKKVSPGFLEGRGFRAGTQLWATLTPAGN